MVNETDKHGTAARTQPALDELQASLGAMNGCLGDGESSYVPSYWNTLSREGAEPKPIRRPQEYAGGERLSILCTQLDLPAKQQRMLVQEWCAFLPSLGNVRTLWFQSRVPQELFDAACSLPSLTGLWIKWSGIRSLDALSRLATLRYLYLGRSGSIESLAPIGAMSQIEWLQLAGTAKATSLQPFASLRHLVGLGFTGGDGKPMETPTLAPLSDLATLEWLHLGALRVADGSLRPLGNLANLRWLGLPNFFAMREFAWLSTRLSRTACDWLAPYCRFHGSVFPCPKCKRNCRVMTSGQPSRSPCPSCDTQRLAEHVLAFNAAVAQARHTA
jgi:hypothetical protein